MIRFYLLSLDPNDALDYKYIVNQHTNTTHIASDIKAELQYNIRKTGFNLTKEAVLTVEVKAFFCGHGDFHPYNQYNSQYQAKKQPTDKLCKTCVKAFAREKANSKT